MQRFRIKYNDEILANVRYKGEIVGKCYFDSGFTRCTEIVNQMKERIDWQIKGTGKRIEVMIYNKSTEQVKYIDTFA